MTQPLTTDSYPSKTLLMTGASGFLGWYLCQEAQRQGWHVHGFYHRHAFPMAGVTMHPVNLTDFDAMKKAIAHIQPTAVIHAAAQARPNACETDPEAAHAINVTASLNLAGLCGDGLQINGTQVPIPCVFISTNQVFDGTQAPYKETDSVSPINVYGEQKIAAEAGVLARHPQALACRMPLMFGNAPTAPSFLQGFLDRIQRGDELKLFIDEFRTPVSGTDAAKGVLLALEALLGGSIPQHTQGRLHLGGAERLSRYDFGQILVDVFGRSLGFDHSCLSACRQADVKMAAARAPDLTMDSACAMALGYQPESVQAGLSRTEGVYRKRR